MSIQLFSSMDQRGPTHTVRSSREERDTLLSSLSLELWQHEGEERVMSDGMQLLCNFPSPGGIMQLTKNFPYFTTDIIQMSIQSVQHTVTNPARYDTVIIIIAVPLWIKNTSEKTLMPLLWRSFVQFELLHTSLSLCLCFFFFFDFLCEEPLEGRKRGKTNRGENTLSRQICSHPKTRMPHLLLGKLRPHITHAQWTLHIDQYYW